MPPQFELGDRVAVDLVRTVREAQRALMRVHRGKRKVVADTAATMRRDCDAVALTLPVVRTAPPTLAERVTSPVPSIRFEDNDVELPKPRIRVTDAAQRLASALHLHLD